MFTFERSHGESKIREKFFNFRFNGFGFSRKHLKLWKKTVVTLQEKNVRITQINNKTYINNLVDCVPETYLESIQAFIMKLFCAFNRELLLKKHAIIKEWQQGSKCASEFWKTFLRKCEQWAGAERISHFFNKATVK